MVIQAGTVATKSPETKAARRGQSDDLRLDEVLKRIDVYGRLAYGGQCVAAMAMIAAPVLFIEATVAPFVLWDDNRAEALTFWLGGWAVAAGVEAGAIALAVFCWRWSGDWITEWPGYAVGVGIGIVANGALAFMLTSTPVPVIASFGITIGAAFLAGFIVAGNLGGTKVLVEQRERRMRAMRRR